MSVPTEVTIDRINQVFQDQGLNTQPDPSGQACVVPFENLLILSQLAGTTLSIQGIWRGNLSEPGDQARAVTYIENHNRSALVPKLYLAETEGEVHLHSESNTVVPEGLTETQLTHFIMMSVAATMNITKEMEDAFPHLLVWKTEGDGDVAGPDGKEESR